MSGSQSVSSSNPLVNVALSLGGPSTISGSSANQSAVVVPGPLNVRRRHPLILPRLPGNHTPRAQNQVRVKQVNFNVRVINPDDKRESQVYVLRDVSERVVCDPKSLTEELRTQFGGDIVSDKLEFPIGYVKGGTKVWIRTESYVQDVWNFVHYGENVSLWCHGVHIASASKKHSSESGSDSDESLSRKPKKKKRKKKVSVLDAKNNRVEEVVTNLRQKHGTQYTTIQYRLWAEMLDVGTHK